MLSARRTAYLAGLVQDADPAKRPGQKIGSGLGRRRDRRCTTMGRVLRQLPLRTILLIEVISGRVCRVDPGPPSPPARLQPTCDTYRSRTAPSYHLPRHRSPSHMA